MSMAFIPQSLANQIANLPILCIYASAQPPTSVLDPSGSPAGSKKTNHWVLHLVTSQTESLQIDPSPGSDSKITIIVSMVEKSIRHDAVKVIRLHTVPDLTVGNIIEYLRASNYIQYQFSTGGQGCRYWICSAISLLRSVGYLVDDSQVEDARATLQLTWDTHGRVRDEEQSGIIAGTFY
jgi:hypothetical protein